MWGGMVCGLDLERLTSWTERKRLCEDDDDTHYFDALLGSFGAFSGKDPDGSGPGRRAQSPGSPRVTTSLLTDSWK